jgi:hypothetical protein
MTWKTFGLFAVVAAMSMALSGCESGPLAKSKAAPEQSRAARAAAQTAEESLDASCKVLPKARLEAQAIIGGRKYQLCTSEGCETVQIRVQPKSTSSPRCVARWTVGSVIVLGQNQPVKWQLTKLNGDPLTGPSYDYSFDPTLGIGICPVSREPNFLDWATRDLSTGQCSDPGTCQSFEWKSLNTRPRYREKDPDKPEAAIHYAPVVYDNVNKEFCDAADPMIVNLGN